MVEKSSFDKVNLDKVCIIRESVLANGSTAESLRESYPDAPCFTDKCPEMVQKSGECSTFDQHLSNNLEGQNLNWIVEGVIFKAS